ncbi:hypothetical protein [Flavobacterium taihuense]|uniref:Uncharacterized protein n=1 Tax=Flavobacterium taihuense TaxID=2857508 RepID=A0ABS6XRP3_9FLAO|nr:hypothetical protein [Flavobacterium taihuense]MBW4359336.1 hypothetical protein [Flavobacterium taihuense]
MNMLLDCTIILIQKLQNKTYETGYICGNFILSLEEIPLILELNNYNLIEVLTTCNNIIDLENLHNYSEKELKFEIKTGDIPNYFETANDFVDGNKFECVLDDFYIADINYRENVSQNISIENYKQNLKLIAFLKTLSDNEKKKDNALELLFYKSGKGTDLKIEYNFDELFEFNTSSIESLKKQLQEVIAGEDKKQLFINELINFIGTSGKSYLVLVKKWDLLILNYDKSYSLFIAGFSFEKIKTSSNEHFQKLVDKISESIGKASTYIFGVPVGYILLLNGFDFTGLQIGKNFTLFILGTIFFILIWNVLFKNIDESIENIELEINDFFEKIDNVTVLTDIKNKLQSLKTTDLLKQRNKLRLVKILSAIIYLILIVITFFTFLNISVFYI